MRAIELRPPRLLSFDGFLLVLILTIGTVGAAMFFLPPETEARTAGGVLLVFGLLSMLPRRVLQVGLDGDVVVVRVVTGTRRFRLAEGSRARVVDGHLTLRLAGTGLPGYHTGYFRFDGRRVRAYTSAVRGPFVMIERPDGAPLVLSPADPEAFVAELGLH